MENFFVIVFVGAIVIGFTPHIFRAILKSSAQTTIDELSSEVEVLNISPNREYKTIKILHAKSSICQERALAKIMKKAKRLDADAVIGVSGSHCMSKVNSSTSHSYDLSGTAIKYI